MNLTKEQRAAANIMFVAPMLDYVRDSVINTKIDDLELISDLDKARLCLKCAVARLDEIFYRIGKKKPE